jgi:5-methylcytosine-specific restriction protein B
MPHHPDRPRFYDAAQRFVDAALRQDDSLFTPGVPIWTAATIDDLYQRFVENPDESSDSFEAKLRRQLSGAAPQTYQLAGEMLYVHLLIAVGTIGSDAKRRLINEVLHWSPAPVAIPADLDAALDHGLASPGTHFNTRRDVHITFLITFARHWKGMPSADRQRALDDPWHFRDLLFDLQVNGAYAQRAALLHIVHPDTFYSTLSREHKAQIAKTFASLVDDPDANVDRQLLQIGQHLQERYGHSHFYDEQLARFWREGHPFPPDGTPSPAETGLPTTLGSSLRPYVKLVTHLNDPAYTPDQIVERLGRISPPIAPDLTGFWG